MKLLVHYSSYEWDEKLANYIVGTIFSPGGADPPFDFCFIPPNVKDEVCIHDNMIERKSPSLEKYDAVIVADRLSRYRTKIGLPPKDVTSIARECAERQLPLINASHFDIPSDVKVEPSFGAIIEAINDSFKKSHYKYCVNFNLKPDLTLLDYSKYFTNDLQPRLKGDRLGMLVSSFGCPFSCSFCIASRKVVFVPIQVIESWLNQLQGLVDCIYFFDETFTLNHHHASNVAKLLKQFGFDWEIQTRIDLVNTELLRLFKKCNCVEIGYGIEHVDKKILYENKTNFTLSKSEVLKMLKLTKNFGISTLVFLVLGLPGESERSVNKLFNFVCENNSWLDGCGAQIATPVKASKLYEMGVRSGKIRMENDIFKYAGTIENCFRPSDIRLIWYIYDKLLSKPSFLNMFSKTYGIKIRFEEWISTFNDV